MPQERNIAEVLGSLRKGLIEQGFDENQAYSLVVELTRQARGLDDLRCA